MRRRPALKKNSIKLKKKLASKRKLMKHIVTLSVIFVFSSVFLTSLILYKFVSHNIASALTADNIGLFESGYPTIMYAKVNELTNPYPEIVSIEMRIYDYESKKVIVYDIPVNLELDVPGRLGKEKISDYLKISNLYTENSDSLKEGIVLLENGLLKVFGLKPERYLIVAQEVGDLSDNLLNSGDFTKLINKEIISNLKYNIKSNLTFNEFAGIAKFSGSLPPDRFIRMELNQEYIEDTEIIDRDIQELMLLSKVSQENYSLAILNGTDREGLAAFGSRVIRNNGGRVVAVSNTAYPSQKSRIISDNPESVTVGKLAEAFGISEVVSKDAARQTCNDAEIDRADATIILGFDLADSLY